MLPIERSLLNDLPVSADPARSRLRLAGTPPSSFYFVGRWGVCAGRGLLLGQGGKARRPAGSRAGRGDPDRGTLSLKIRTMRVEIANANVANQVVVSTGGTREPVARPW